MQSKPMSEVASIIWGTGLSRCISDQNKLREELLADPKLQGGKTLARPNPGKVQLHTLSRTRREETP